MVFGHDGRALYVLEELPLIEAPPFPRVACVADQDNLTMRSWYPQAFSIGNSVRELLEAFSPFRTPFPGASFLGEVS